MAVDTTPKLTRRTSVLAKTETTTGTAIALADTDGAFNAYNITYNPDIAIEERLGQAGWGVLASIHGTRYATIDFEVDLAGKGSSGAPTWASTLLGACGFTASGSIFTTGYNASQPTLTIGCYLDGVKVAIAGAAGSVTFPLRTGFPCRARFSFMGKVVADSDVAIVTPTGLSTKPPTFANNAVTFASYTPKLSSLEIAVVNTLSMREDPADDTGARSCVIVDQRINITADPEFQLVADRDWYTLLTGHTAENLSVAVGTAANNTMTFAGTSALQWTQIPFGERNGMRTRQVTGQIVGGAMTLTFS